MNLNISKWKFYSIDSLFSIEKGTRLKKANMIPGNIRYIGASAFNNGVTAYISNNAKLHPANTITISYNGSVGSSFYQDEIFWASDDVNVLYPKFAMTRNIALFFLPILQNAGAKYKHIDKWTKELMAKTEIKLPVNDNKPDWDFMEEYIERITSKANRRIQSICHTIKEPPRNICTSNWNTYEVGKLFAIVSKLEVYHVKDVKETTEGVPYVVRSKFNNGIKYYVEKTPLLKCSPAGVISFGAENASFFYQKREWCSGRDIYYIDTRLYSENVCMFIVTCLNQISKKYPYNYGLFPKLLAKETIKLPSKNDGTPDWDFMEDYIYNIRLRVQKNIIVVQK